MEWEAEKNQGGKAQESNREDDPFHIFSQTEARWLSAIWYWE